jgi:prevent-host-death family protein
MRTVNVHESKTQCSALLAAVVAGGQVVITKASRPLARLLPIEGTAERELAIDDGRISIAREFDKFIPAGFEPYS